MRPLATWQCTLECIRYDTHSVEQNFHFGAGYFLENVKDNKKSKQQDFFFFFDKDLNDRITKRQMPGFAQVEKPRYLKGKYTC